MGVLNIVCAMFHILVVVSQYCYLLSCSGKNVVHQLGVTLEELYNGSTRKLGLQKNVICEKCDGKKVTSLLSSFNGKIVIIIL